jgi:hypothetical protein
MRSVRQTNLKATRTTKGSVKETIELMDFIWII